MSLVDEDEEDDEEDEDDDEGDEEFKETDVFRVKAESTVCLCERFKFTYDLFCLRSFFVPLPPLLFWTFLAYGESLFWKTWFNNVLVATRGDKLDIVDDEDDDDDDK